MDENEYITLILKHLNKETSPAEEVGLQQWLDADPDHRREYQALEEIWNESGPVLNARQFDKTAAWKKMEERLGPLRRERARPLPWKGMLAAASVLLVLGMGGWWMVRQRAAGSSRTVIAEDGPLQFLLPDSSTVELHKGATLTYLPSYNTRDRRVELQGEAFFAVTHHSDNPFIITTTHAILEDLGTSFLVKNGKDSDVVRMATGEVRFTDRDDPSHSIVLFSGREATLKGNQFTQSTAVNRSFISWKTGVLEFRDELLAQAAEELGSFYRVPVSIDPDLQKDAGTITLNARFDHQALAAAIEEIRLMTRLTIRQEKDTLVFSR